MPFYVNDEYDTKEKNRNGLINRTQNGNDVTESGTKL